jgi:hypothetical protein
MFRLFNDAVLTTGVILWQWLFDPLIIDWLTTKLLLATATTVILGSAPHGTHDHIL